jgi:hypothetical protein
LKIVCMYGDNPLASWMLSRGMPSVLRRMGHEVIEIPTLGTAQVTQSDVDRINKPIQEDTDLILVSGPEYLLSWIKKFYPQWDKLKIPKACWFHESSVRDDRTCDFSKITPYFDFAFMPNKDDAEQYKGIHLQIGVDAEMFCPHNDEFQHREIECAFIGTVYEKRRAFLQAMAPHMNGFRFKVGQALVQDLDGVNLVKSVKLLASEYRRIKILLNLPTLSNVLVSKILEASASGCLVLTPFPVHTDVGIPYVAEPKALAEAIHALRNHPEIATAKAKEHRDLVLKNHRMESRFEDIFAACGAGEAVAK